MKAKRFKKVIGISLGDRSLLAAEVVAGDRPQVRRVAEMAYPQGVSILNPAELGKALAEFLRSKEFSGGAAVVGLPVKWLVVKSKEVPPADDATLTNMLRIGVEAEFPSDLKDLVFDFSSESGGRGASRNVMLLGTPKARIDAVVSICQAAGLNVISILPSALALGGATGGSDAKNLVVLSVASSGSEFSIQQGLGSSAIQHLRASSAEPSFVSELRRNLSMLPRSASGREMILWDGTGLNAASLGEQLGIHISSAELDTLGVDTSLTGTNGDGSRYAAAVALALVGIEGTPGVDFLHSRLAPLKVRHVTREIVLAAVAAIAMVIGIVFAYRYLHEQEAILEKQQAVLKAQQPEIDQAEKFIKTVSFASYWHEDQPLYLACLRDLTNAMPPDGFTFATALDIKAETPHAAAASSIKPDTPQTLTVKLTGKTSDSKKVDVFVAQMNKYPDRFTKIRRPSEKLVGRPPNTLWYFEITFTYVLPKPVPAAATTKKSGPTTR